MCLCCQNNQNLFHQGKLVCDDCVCGLLAAFRQTSRTLWETTVSRPSGTGEPSTLVQHVWCANPHFLHRGEKGPGLSPPLDGNPPHNMCELSGGTWSEKGRGLLIHQSLNRCNVWTAQLRRSSWRDYTYGLNINTDLHWHNIFGVWPLKFQSSIQGERRTLPQSHRRRISSSCQVAK